METEKEIEKESPDAWLEFGKWCPLSGELPLVDYTPNSPVYQCREIIIEARHMWGVGPGLNELKGFASLNNQKFDYPEKWLSTARTIFEDYDSVSLHMIDGYYTTSTGKVRERHSLATKWQDAIDFVRSFHLGMHFEEETPDHAVLAILAIAEAHIASQWILVHGDPEDDPIVQDRIYDARSLLYQAKTIEAEAIQGEYKRVLPHVERDQRRQEQFRSAQDALHEKAEHRHGEWLRIAKEVKEKNSTLSLRSVAKCVYERTKDSENFAVRFNTIYKFLLKNLLV